eukprot:1157680-Pelagomonas_calceolata.AAC.1
MPMCLRTSYVSCSESQEAPLIPSFATSAAASMPMCLRTSYVSCSESQEAPLIPSFATFAAALMHVCLCMIRVIQEAQSAAARIFGADHTWFLVNGCTVGIHAAVMAVANFYVVRRFALIELANELSQQLRCLFYKHTRFYDLDSGLLPAFSLRTGSCIPQLTETKGGFAVTSSDLTLCPLRPKEERSRVKSTQGHWQWQPKQGKGTDLQSTLQVTLLACVGQATCCCSLETATSQPLLPWRSQAAYLSGSNQRRTHSSKWPMASPQAPYKWAYSKQRNVGGVSLGSLLCRPPTMGQPPMSKVLKAAAAAAAAADEGPELGQKVKVHRKQRKVTVLLAAGEGRHLWLEDHGKHVDGVHKAASGVGLCLCTRCWTSCSAVAMPVPVPLLLLPDQAAAVTAAVAIAGAAMQTSRSQHARSKLQSSALKYLKSPQRNKLKEMHIDVFAQGFQSIECQFEFLPLPRCNWQVVKCCKFEALKKRGRYMAQQCAALKGTTVVT